MSDGYDWSISRQATSRFIRLSSSRRTELLQLFDHLAANVHLPPESKFPDAEGREFLIATAGSLVVTYHVDHAVKMVYVVAVE